MNRETVSRIGNWGAIALLAGAFFLPTPFKDWAYIFLIIWVAGSIAYKSAMDSKKANAQLYSKALFIAVCLGGVTFLFYGAPSVDQDGQFDDDGFPATFDQSAGAGVTAFVRLYLGAMVGIWLAGQVGRPGAPAEKQELSHRAAEQGDADAQYGLGICYQKGEGVPKDDVEAVKWFRKAADQGNANAVLELGLHYARGEGVPKDDVESVRWCRKAAEQGHAEAQCSFGMNFWTGTGVLKDLVEAAKWWILAIEKGDKVSATLLKSIEKKMTSEQIAEAHRRADEFKRQHAVVTNPR